MLVREIKNRISDALTDFLSNGDADSPDMGDALYSLISGLDFEVLLLAGSDRTP